MSVAVCSKEFERVSLSLNKRSLHSKLYGFSRKKSTRLQILLRSPMNMHAEAQRICEEQVRVSEIRTQTENGNSFLLLLLPSFLSI